MSMKVIVYTPQAQVFEADQVLKVAFSQKVDLYYGRLPETTMEVVLYSDAPLQLQNEQKVAVYWDGRLLATEYVRFCQRLSKKRYSIRCGCQLEYLQSEFIGAIYMDESEVTPQLEQLMEGRTFDMDVPLTGEALKGYVPIGTKAEALQQMAFAIGATVTVGNHGDLWLRCITNNDPVTLPPSRLEAAFPVRYLPDYTRFELAAHSFTRLLTRVTLK